MSSSDDTTVSAAPAASSPRRPFALKVALAVVTVEALAFLGLAVAEVVTTGQGRVVMAVSTAAFFLGWGVTLLACVRGMWHRQTWGRSLVVLGQLLQLGVAWSYRSATPELAGWLAVTGLVVLAGLFMPPSLRWFEHAEE